MANSRGFFALVILFLGIGSGINCNLVTTTVPTSTAGNVSNPVNASLEARQEEGIGEAIFNVFEAVVDAVGPTEPPILLQIGNLFSQVTTALNTNLNGTDTPNFPSFFIKHFLNTYGIIRQAQIQHQGLSATTEAQQKSTTQSPNIIQEFPSLMPSPIKRLTTASPAPPQTNLNPTSPPKPETSSAEEIENLLGETVDNPDASDNNHDLKLLMYLLEKYGHKLSSTPQPLPQETLKVTNEGPARPFQGNVYYRPSPRPPASYFPESAEDSSRLVTTPRAKPEPKPIQLELPKVPIKRPTYWMNMYYPSGIVSN